MNVKYARGKRNYNPCLNKDTVLWWLQPTPEMGLDLRVWDLCIDYSRFIKKQKQNNKKNIKNETSLRRGTRRARPKYGQSALHLSSGREIDKHRVECTKPSTQLGSPSLGRLREVRILTRDSGCNICFLSILYTVPFDIGDPTCPLTAVKCLFLELKKKIALSKWLVLIDFHVELKSPKLLLYSIWMRRGKLSYIQVTLFLLLFIRFAVIFISFPCSL